MCIRDSAHPGDARTKSCSVLSIMLETRRMIGFHYKYVCACVQKQLVTSFVPHAFFFSSCDAGAAAFLFGCFLGKKMVPTRMMVSISMCPR